MSAQTSRVAVNDFVSQKTLALVGVSRNRNKFGSFAFRTLKSRGYKIFPVSRSLNEIEGTKCYPSLQDLPEKVEGVLIVVPPDQTEQIVKEAESAGIKRVFMQQGAESETAIQYCHDHGITEVHGECILMFAEPVKSYHRFHRVIMRICGKLPQ